MIHKMRHVISPIPFALAAALSLPGRAQAQPDPYTVERLADSVFAVVRKTPTTGASDSNVLFIIGSKDVVVVDANIFPSSARQVIAEIKKRTLNPVRYVINTHWHDDHVTGNEEYTKVYPGVQFIAHPFARENVLGSVTTSLKTYVNKEYPEIIQSVKNQLASGKRRSGAALTAADSARLKSTIALYEFYLSDTKKTTIVAPNVTVADSLRLYSADREIVVKWIGLGNTAGDLVVYLPAERIVASGDLVVHPIPFGFGSLVPEWAETLRRLKGLGATTLMPGHGPIMRDWGYVDSLIELIEFVGAEVAKAVAAGADLEATRKAVNLDAFRDKLAGTSELLRGGFNELFATPIVEAAFQRAKQRSGAVKPE